MDNGEEEAYHKLRLLDRFNETHSGVQSLWDYFQSENLSVKDILGSAMSYNFVWRSLSFYFGPKKKE